LSSSMGVVCTSGGVWLVPGCPVWICALVGLTFLKAERQAPVELKR
jgi:hypothetical protein